LKDVSAPLASLGLVVMLLAFLVAVRPRFARAVIRDEGPLGLQAVELYVEEEGQTREVRAPVPITIGREPSATIVLRDPRVSRLHARVESLDGAIVVRDLGSRNGTLVNARPIEAPVVLRDGDEIEVGTARLVYSGVGPWK
jgi:pSer/pThr/pTyr-binding forkhead associated (FHA) protein